MEKNIIRERLPLNNKPFQKVKFKEVYYSVFKVRETLFPLKTFFNLREDFDRQSKSIREALEMTLAFTFINNATLEKLVTSVNKLSSSKTVNNHYQNHWLRGGF